MAEPGFAVLFLPLFDLVPLGYHLNFLTVNSDSKKFFLGVSFE